MDPFDDILPAAPAARGRLGGKFAPKAKSKQLSRKEVSASEHKTSSKDGKDECVAVASSSTSKGTEGISQIECHDAVGSILNMPPEQSIGSKYSSQVELPDFEDATKSEVGNPQQFNVDTAALVDAQPSKIALSEIGSDWNLTNISKSSSEADPVASDVGPDTSFIPENLSDDQPADADGNLLSNVAAQSTTCSTRGNNGEPPENGKGSFPDSNKHLELIDNSLQVGSDVGFESATDHSVAISKSDIQSNFNFGREREAESGKFELDPFSDILPDSGTRTAHKFQPKIKPRPRVGTKPAMASNSSNVMMGRSVELPTSCTNEVQSFLPSGDGSGGLDQSINSSIPTSNIPNSSNLSNKFDYMSSSILFSEDKGNMAAVTPSQLDSRNAMLSEVAVHDGTRDWPSSLGKSAGENADIFSGLESLDDVLTPAATDTGKPALESFNEKGTEENIVISACSSLNSIGVSDTAQLQKSPGHHTNHDSLTLDEGAVLNEDDTCANNRRSETEEAVDFTPGCPVDNVLDYQSIKSGTDPASDIPVHEELPNSADSPTLADLLQAGVTGEKENTNGRKKDGTILTSFGKRRRSSAAGEEDNGVKTSRQQRKQAARKPVDNSVNEDDDDLDPPYNPNGDELEENDDEFEVDYSSKKKASLSSTKKSVSKNGKTSEKRTKTNEGSENTAKEPPKKKFSHSTRRRKRCVDRALLEIPEDELDPRTLPLKDIILLAEYRERLAKKEATTSKTTSTNQSGGDSLHEAEAGANSEEFLGSEDGREPGEDQATESVPLAPSLFNYQSFMDKPPRGKWTKQDTELFYEAVRQFGTDFSMIQQLFPDRTRHQIKLKYKKEERQHPLQLADAVHNRAKDHSHFKLVIERLQQASTKADQDPGRDASDFMTAEEVEDLAPGTNGEVAPTTEQEQEQEKAATTEQGQEANVKDQEDSNAIHSPEQSDDNEDGFDRWAQYKSEY